ncbi:MAG: hypothetical protein KAU83_13400 [Bacteroidales bacterium]|nr:hypothetical protein [Bacteroidales bacterium]
MKTIFRLISICFLITISMYSYSQKGLGKQTGISHEINKTSVFNLNGELLEIKIGPCEYTSGRYEFGTHLILRNSKDDSRINIHLGPTQEVQYVVDQLTIGNELKVKAFRTSEMPEDNYIAQEIIYDRKVITLRDKNLRPFWAGKGWRFK